MSENIYTKSGGRDSSITDHGSDTRGDLNNRPLYARKQKGAQPKMRITREVLDEHVDPNDPPEWRSEPITIEVKTELDEHEEHAWERTETLRDNIIEWTSWGHCLDCDQEFIVRSTTWLN